jgi:hypothetical protein
VRIRQTILFLLLASSALAQIQILAQPQIIDDPAFKHIRLQRWLLRICNPDPAPRNLSDDTIYVAVPTVPFIPGPQAAGILQGKVNESVPAKLIRYVGYANDGAVGVTVSGLVAASSPIKAGLTIGLLAFPLIQRSLQAETPSITSLMENVLGYPGGTPVSLPAGDSRTSGCTHYFAYSPKFSKKSPAPATVTGHIGSGA